MEKKEIIESVKRWFQLYMSFDTPDKMLEDFKKTTGLSIEADEEESRYYITNEIFKYKMEVKDGDTINFEMPPMCSGEYEAIVHKDKRGFYIDKKDNFFSGCRDFFINRKLWN